MGTATPGRGCSPAVPPRDWIAAWACGGPGPLPGTNSQVLHFARPGGWRCVTNFGPGPAPLPDGTVILTSTAFEGTQLPADTTAWLISG
jgi:hypothetical protein